MLQAVETETIDVLYLSVAGELPISKETEELLKSAKTSIYIYRNNQEAARSDVNLLPVNVIEEAPTEGYAYTKR